MGWVLLLGLLAYQIHGYINAPEPYVEKVLHIEKAQTVKADD
jgi:hypothetical protein